MAEFDLKKASTTDRGVIGGGAVVLIASLFPWYGTSGDLAGFAYNRSISGWSSGLLAVLGILLCIAAAGLVAYRVFGPGNTPDLPLSENAFPLALSGLGLVSILLRLLTFDRAGGGGFSVGPKIGVFLALIGAAAQAYFAYRAFKASGEKMAFDNTKMPKFAGPSAPPATGWAPPPASGAPAAPAAASSSAPAAPPAAPQPHEHDHGVDGHDHPHA